MKAKFEYKYPQWWYALRLNNQEERMNSQSGGASYSFGEHIIKEDGVVYGCVYDGVNVVHTRIDNLEQLHMTQGSKYVQSHMGQCYKQLLVDLKDSKKVLFTGTPCQCAGLLTFLDKMNIDVFNLVTCEFICHGVPSPRVYKDYLTFMEHKYGKDILNVNLRDKKAVGWQRHLESITFLDGEKYIGRTYVDLFYSNLALRRSCENCKFTKIERVTDITVADCWGIENNRPDLWNDNEGISMVLVQTDKGKNLFDSVVRSGTVDIVELQPEEFVQPQMKYPSPTPYQKEQFWKDYHKYSFERILKKYTEYGGIPFKIKRKIMKTLNKW